MTALSSFRLNNKRGESVENFYGRLIEQAENCSLGNEETTLIRDAFILNMMDNETQKELLNETVEPTKALEVAIQMEMGARNQQKINQNLALTTNSVNAVNTFQTLNYSQSRITNQLARTSHATHLYTKTITTRVFVKNCGQR